MAYSSTEQEEQRVSKWNSMGMVFARLDMLWRRIHTCASVGEYEKWNITLDRIWSELVEDAKAPDEEAFGKLNVKIAGIGFIRGVTSHKLLKKQELYGALMEKETFLRKLQNKSGKSMGYEESLEDYMDG